MVSTRSTRGAARSDGGAEPAPAIAKKPAAKRAKPAAKKESKPKAEPATRADGEVRYWLLKSEPESRVVKGVDMKFGIDDLANCKDQTEPWDGVRNHEAKNAMLAMAAGDLGFFYRELRAASNTTHS